MAPFRRFSVFLAVILLLSSPQDIFCAAKADVAESVQALQSEGKTFCTAFSINEAAGLWSTEAHCAAYALEHKLDVTILGEPAWVVFVGFPSIDIAVFQSDAHKPALKLAQTAPKVGDAIYVIGYPMGITKTLTKGTMAAINIPLEHPSTGYYMTSDILDITTTGGNSGSPVFNSAGEVIGTLWGGFNESAHSIGTSYEGTMRTLAPFVGR